MEWKYPEISLENVVKLVKGFVDILILASGHQSSGHPARWDVESMKKALQWSFFFEKLIRNLRSKDEYVESLKLLDAELNVLTSYPHLPQGLKGISCETLSRAKEMVVRHFLQSMPLRREHLLDLLKVSTEMDLEELRGSEDDCLDVYLMNLMLQTMSVDCANGESKGCDVDNITACIIQEIMQRQKAVSYMSTAEKGLEALFKAAKCSASVNADDAILNEQWKHSSTSLHDGQVVEYATWKNWRSESLAYFLDKRTMRLVSGAALIFSVPQTQWVHIFEGLHLSKDIITGLPETIELLLLGCLADKWNHFLSNFMSLSYVPIPISKQYAELQNILTGKPQTLISMAQGTKEYEILKYLGQLLGGKLHLLQNVSPVLLAAAIPQWSPLFRSYLSGIESQLKQDSPANRYCSCTVDMAHTSCVLAERIWYLHSFHVQDSFHIGQSGSSTI